MKIKKKQMLLSLLILLIIIVGYLFFFKQTEISLIVPYEKNYTQNDKKNDDFLLPKKLEKNDNASAISDIKTIKVKLTALGNDYQTEIKENSSVFDAMEKIEKENKNLFTFKYKEYSGMGIFINEINNEGGLDGEYWTYDVNGKTISAGVTDYNLNEGDIINWKKESL